MSELFRQPDRQQGKSPRTTSRPSYLCRSWVLFLLAAIWFINVATAQELTPRAYWPAPKGTQVLVLGYGYQTGDVVTDLSLPVVGVDSKIHSGGIAYQHTLSLFGRTSNLQFEVPWVKGTTSGEVEGLSSRREMKGFGDVSAELSVNLLGAPSMNAEEFRAFRAAPQPILAASLKILAPTGEYDKDRLINIGTNRWATRLRLGYVRPLGNRWVLETAVGVWLFQDNDEFLNKTREQKPITALEVGLIRRFRPGFWASLDLNYYFGGRTIVDDQELSDLQRNSRIGFTLVYPVKGFGALRASYTSGLVTKSGGDYDTVTVSWIFLLR